MRLISKIVVLLCFINLIGGIWAKNGWSIKEAIGFMGYSKNFNGTWISDTEILYTNLAKDYKIFDITTKQSRILVPNKKLPSWTRPKFDLTKDKKKLLVRHDDEKLFRHSMIAKYDVYDIETGKIYSIGNKKKLQYCTFAPTSDRIAFVVDNNVYVRQPDGTEHQLTTDGKIGVIYNGIPDWVYEEEVLSTGSALWWSPSGDKLAMGHFDDTLVKTFKYFVYGDSADSTYQYPTEVDLKYPKAGTTNPLVALKVLDLQQNLTQPKWVDINAPSDIVSSDHIMNNIAWSGNNQIVVTWMNRRQNKAVLSVCELNEKCKNSLELKEPNGWIVISRPNCNIDGKTCTFLYWIGNWLQVWKLDLKTGENLWKSMGNFTVLKYYGFKEDTGDRFYQATRENNPTQHHLYKNKECISCKVKDSNGVNCTQATAVFSSNLSYYSLTCLGPKVSYTKLFDSNTQREIFNWETNDAVRRNLETKLLPKIKYLKVPIANGKYQALVKLYLPPGLDFNNPPKKKKYPLVVDVYAGPNSAKINDALKIHWSTYMTVTHDLIYCEIESRGSANKGKDMLFTVNNRLGTDEVDDQIYVTNYLQNTYDFIDENRSGIWGWSYGGYATAMTIAKDNKNVFQCGISVAPVTAWFYYDTIYTERYMGLPTDKDNLANYVKSDVTKHIDNFRTHEYLLIHGLGDDNVHAQQSMFLSKTLQQYNIMFEEMFYPDENHSIGNLLIHVYYTMDRFWTKCFNLRKLN